MREDKYTMEDLQTMQSWTLARKIQVTQTRIIEWYQKNDGNVYVSFSGGKDSTVLLDLVRRIYPDVPAVFCDTGLEYPEIRDFVKTKENVVWVKPEMNFKKVIETYGYPLVSKDIAKQIRAARGGARNAILAFDGKNVAGSETPFRKRYKKWKFLYESDIPISELCCEIMKKKPAKEYEKRTGRKPILGTMAAESALRTKSWLKNGCNAFDGKRPTSQPMSFWLENDVLEYLKSFDVPYCCVYGEIVSEDGKYRTTLCDRTGCVFCGFGCHLEKEPNRFQRLQQTHPQLYAYCMKPKESGGLGLKEPLEFIGVKTEMEATK